MRWMKWTGIGAAILLAGSCFMPWVYVSWKDFTATGIYAGEKFQHPASFHFLFTVLFILLTLVPKIWAMRWNLLVVALNTAWALRNFLIIPTCAAGLCPEKKSGIYLMLLSSLLMLVSALFPDIKGKQKEK